MEGLRLGGGGHPVHARSHFVYFFSKQVGRRLCKGGNGKVGHFFWGRGGFAFVAFALKVHFMRVCVSLLSFSPNPGSERIGKTSIEFIFGHSSQKDQPQFNITFTGQILNEKARCNKATIIQRDFQSNTTLSLVAKNSFSEQVFIHTSTLRISYFFVSWEAARSIPFF